MTIGTITWNTQERSEEEEKERSEEEEKEEDSLWSLPFLLL